MAEEVSVTSFRDYLRIHTEQPEPNYDAAVDFLCKLAVNVGLSSNVVMLTSNKPVVLLSMLGSEPKLPSILLNSHMDVVPVFLEHWIYGPFDAHKDANGNIYGRGSQDMKCVGIQYVEALRRLIRCGKTFTRSIHVCFVPDEEIGGGDGMALFAKSTEFQHLNVGFALDEGLASATDTYSVYNGERSPWWLEVSVPGNPGHGSMFIENTAVEKLQSVLCRFMSFRETEKQKLANDAQLSVGDVIAVNATMIHGGVQINVVPSEFKICFDIRIPPSVNQQDFEKQIDSWLRAISPDITYRYLQQTKITATTDLSASNQWWCALRSTFEKLGMKFKTQIFPGATDARFLRQIGIPAIGFSPMINTPVLLHDHNEFLNESVFLRGVDIYTELIPVLANLSL